MTNEAGAAAPVDGRFRPESIFHFKEVAKNLAWLLERPMQKCQEDLARIYGYSGLHELQQILQVPGIPGPFDPRYNFLESDDEELVEAHEQRIFYILFGAPTGFWRERSRTNDRGALVFEMGLFQEASEHRACFLKIKQVLDDQLPFDKWPLINGWPLGLRSWLVSRYTEPVDLVQGWENVLTQSQYSSMRHADIRWQLRMTGLARLATMFKILAPRVGGRKPIGMTKVAFEEFEDDAGGICDPSWEPYYLLEWLAEKLSKGTEGGMQQQIERIDAFIRRPSRSTAAECVYVKNLKDPAAFRDRWAFESFKAALDIYCEKTKALFSSSLDEGVIQSIFLHMDGQGADISESYGCQLWEFNCTWSKVTETIDASSKPTLQPVIHALGSLIVPYDQNLSVLDADDWYFLHDSSDFASESAAVVFEKLYLPAIGFKHLDFVAYPPEWDLFSIVEIDELLIAPSVSAVDLKSYFFRFLKAFEVPGYFPDSYGYWCGTLSLTFEDEQGNDERNQNMEYADYVSTPSVLLINVDGCGLTAVEAIHKNGKPISTLSRNPRKKATPRAEALATMVLEAVKGLRVDVVVYDGEI